MCHPGVGVMAIVATGELLQPTVGAGRPSFIHPVGHQQGMVEIWRG